MAPFPSPRPAPWMPAAGLLAAATLSGVAVAWLLGARVWWAYLGMVLAVILAVGAAERLLAQRAQPRPPRARGKLKVLPGGKSGFDLEKDDPENPPRWLM
jgi:hypothetical protein